MKKVLSNIFSILLLVILFAACTEPIDWEVDENDAKIVVEGRFTTELKQHEIQLTKTADYFSYALPEGVSNANVTISDGEQTFSLTESADKAGLYLTEEIAGEVNKTYTLQISLNQPIGGESQFQASSHLSPVIPIDSLSIRLDTVAGFGTEDIFWVISMWGQEVKGEESYYQASILSNGSPITESVLDYVVWNDFLVEDEYFEELDLWSGDDFFIGDTATLVLYSSEQLYEEFIEGVRAELEGPDELGFSGPPANAVGNVSNGGLGYFIASDVSRATTIVPEQ